MPFLKKRNEIFQLQNKTVENVSAFSSETEKMKFRKIIYLRNIYFTKKLNEVLDEHIAFHKNLDSIVQAVQENDF